MLMHMSQVAVVPTSVALHCNRTVHHVSLCFIFGDTCNTYAKPLGGAVGVGISYRPVQYSFVTLQALSYTYQLRLSCMHVALVWFWALHLYYIINRNT